MEINGYNEDDLKFSQLIKDLKELPQVKTEENFEYNLMMRIQNKNFGNLMEEDKPQFGMIKLLIPSAVVSIIILLVLFLPNAEHQIDNPLMTDPPQITSNNELKDSQLLSAKAESSLSKSKRKNTGEKIISENNQINGEANNIIANPKIKYPLNRNRSVSLDDYISGQNPKNTNLQRGNVVRSGEDEYGFDGFLLPQELDQKTLQKYRRMIDSIKKAEAKADSIRRNTR